MKNNNIERIVGITPNGSENLEDRYKKVLKIFSSNNFNRILDVGCADGNFTKLLGKACNASEIYGIEISDAGIELARKNGILASKIDINDEDLPFENEYFDAIFAGEIIEHIFDTDYFLKEIFRVLKKNGLFVLTTPNLASIHNRIALLFGYQPYPIRVSPNHGFGHFIHPGWGAYDHIRAMTLKGLLNLLRYHNFEILAVQSSGLTFPNNFSFFGIKIIKFFDKIISDYLYTLGYHSIIKTKKISEDTKL